MDSTRVYEKKRQRDEQMTFTKAGVGCCRKCGRPLGMKADNRNFNVCVFIDEDKAKAAAKVEDIPNRFLVVKFVKLTQFRCLSCNILNRFIPYKFPLHIRKANQQRYF